MHGHKQGAISECLPWPNHEGLVFMQLFLFLSGLRDENTHEK